uniref:(northern house mosquito) hypothetical protein n=1 Tax=Culex pipiens TaxID=7175 RepID=A0A8D8L5G8_CULPI
MCEPAMEYRSGVPPSRVWLLGNGTWKIWLDLSPILSASMLTCWIFFGCGDRRVQKKIVGDPVSWAEGRQIGLICWETSRLRMRIAKSSLILTESISYCEADPE